MSSSPIIWKAKPEQGLHLSLANLVSSMIYVMFGSVIVYALSSTGNNLILSGVFALMTTYLAIGRLYHDAHIRQRLLYCLTADSLTIYNDRSNSVIRVIPIGLLKDVRAGSPDYTSGIELPSGACEIVQGLTDTMVTLVPSFHPRRLELVADASNVARLIRHTANKG